MTCENCELSPGKVIRVGKEGHCVVCGREIKMSSNYMTDYYREKLKRWDTYFHKVCEAIASKSPCLSHQIGAILVRDHSIVSTGFNGPARGYPHCKPVRIRMPDITTPTEIHTENVCPRHAKGYKSGEGLLECPAAHAEANCIANAARIGASTIGTTLYLNFILPCKDCAIILVNAGIVEVVVESTRSYHEMSIKILKQGNIKTRKFIL